MIPLPRKSIFLIMFWSLLVTLATSLSLSAQISYSGDTTGKPTFHRTRPGMPPQALADNTANSVHYHKYDLSVPTSGLYDLFTQSNSGFDPFLALYASPFNPAAPLTNVLAANDDLYEGNYLQSGFIYPLFSGTPYSVITAGFDNFEFGTFTNTFTLIAELRASVTATTTGKPVWNRPEEGEPPSELSSFAKAVPYHVVKLRVASDGHYFFLTRATTAFDIFSVLYQDSFNPASPLTNALIARDDFGDSNDSYFETDLWEGVDYFLVTTGFNNTAFGDFRADIFGPDTVIIGDARSISGKVTRADCPAQSFDATFVLHPTSGSDLTLTASVDAAGNFSLNNIPSGSYKLKVYSDYRLSRVVAADVSTGNVTGLNVGALPGGDATNDNSVDVLDLDALIRAFDAAPGDANWNVAADFNCDNSVDVLDLDVLIRNFDKSGEDF